MATSRLQRFTRRVRFFHAGIYLTTLALLLTGWWLYLGGEGHPSPLSRIFDIGDTRLHVWVGRALAVLTLVPVIVGRKGIATFVRETFRRDRGDARWWVRWPAGAFNGRFGHHEGHFDPGQRVANVLLVGGLLVLVGTGLGLSFLHGGPVFALLAKVHLWTTYAVTALVAGHVLIAVGILPGYRGVWRSMHLGGKMAEETARRVWPGWTERALRERQGDASERHEVAIVPAPPPSLRDRVERALNEEWDEIRGTSPEAGHRRPPG
jgi:cytochrome b subunit of formate dehydrogenase